MDTNTTLQFTEANNRSSGADVAVDLLGVAKHPVVAVVKGHRPNLYFGDHAFQHPDILQKPSISHIAGRTVHFTNATSIEDVDAFVVGTGYSWTLPFLPHIPIRNNRVPDLYQHIFHQSDPTLVFIGAVRKIDPSNAAQKLLTAKTGRRRPDIQGLRVAIRLSRTSPSRPCTTTSTLRTAEMGTRQDCEERGRCAVHCNLSWI